MKEKRSPFFAFRYLVTPISAQRTITQELNKSKEELMNDIVINLNENTKTDWNKGNKRYLIYSFQNLDQLFMLKYARESNENIFVEGDDDIEIKDIKETKFVYLIIDTDKQIILIERNSSVFNSVRSSVNILANFFRDKMRQFDYVVNIYPLVKEYGFWNYVNEAEKIYELNLLLNAPNMFLGDPDTRKVLEKIKETTNNEEFELAFRNKEGRLKIIKETLGNWIDYVREVGGRYKLKFSKNGIDETKTSDDDTAKTYIKRKKKEKYSDEELNEIKEKVDLIHKLESRDETAE